MDGMEFVAKLAWPVTVLILAFKFGNPVLEVLKKLRSAKGAGLEVQFDADTKKVVNDATQIESAPPTNVRALTTEQISNARKVAEQMRPYFGQKPVKTWAEMQGLRPSAKILETWNEIEQLAKEIAHERAIDLAGDRPYCESSLDALLAEGILSDELVALVARMHELRDRVAFSEGFEPTNSAAMDYFLAAMKVKKALEQVRSSMHRGPNS